MSAPEKLSLESEERIVIPRIDFSSKHGKKSENFYISEGKNIFCFVKK